VRARKTERNAPFNDDDPEFSSISSLERIGNTLYLGTLDEAGIGRIKL